MPAKIKPKWTVPVTSPGLGGVAATEEYVIFSDRELEDSFDSYKCLKADTGEEVWSLIHPALGNLDYGNSPRATPVIADGRVYLFGAFGDLFCLDLKTGENLWQINLRIEFEPDDEPKWGACSTPLLVNGIVVVNPGAKEASLVGLDAKSGKILWKTPGNPAGYGSLILAKLGGVEQIVGHDKVSLNGWDPKTGQRLWRLVPEQPNDFNVPTPIVYGDKLIVITENNGTRLYQFQSDGKIDPKPLAINRRLAPDTHTPVLVGDKLFGVWRRLYCLDLTKNLEPVYDSGDQAFTKYCAAVATDDRVLIINMNSELILLDAKEADFTELGRLTVLPGEKGLYSHPAFVGKRFYVRGSTTMAAFEWE